jgi:curved DNA-binding protein CbpA
LKATPNYYAILGATEDASPRELERLYKRQAHKRHPDRGGSEEEMKTLNEAYRVLRHEDSRREYDANRSQTQRRSARVEAAPAAREVGMSGQTLSAFLCIVLGLMLLFLVRFNGLWFLWPLSILAVGVVAFGIFIAHAAMTNTRATLPASNPMRRFRVAQEILFWLIIAGGGYGVYLILTSI